MKNLLKKSKGITLIALVVTLILLLILAGTSISMLAGENGILSRAAEAKEKIQNSQSKELSALSKLESEMLQNQDDGFDKEKGVNRPELRNGMTRIMFEEPTSDNAGNNLKNGKTIKDGENGWSENWYDYSQKKWANTMTKDGSMWVWIPRFAYNIDSNDKMDILFLVGTSNKCYNTSSKKIEDLPDGEEISFYKQGDFTDLCAGPHLMSTGKVKCVKLLSTSGAYWRGDEKNKMLQRIYAISFPKASLLEEHLAKLEEAKQRDHRKLGKDLELFMTHKLVGSGLPMYLPNGATVRRLLERYIQDKEIRMGYKHVYTPSLANVELYKTSGHWDHYKEDMFPVMKMDNEELVLRPMNCPHHMLIFKSKMRSYKDLPIRIGELAHDFRYEDSGTVCGIERVREMCQNDAHLFVRPDQIKDEVGKVVKLILDVYKDFGFKDYKFRLSLRDKNDKHKYFDDDEMWDKAESQLREILTELGLDFYEAEGEAAFYGPKLDVQLKSAIGHDVTVSTCQLDFLLPQRFELEYIGEDGKAHRPVVIHRAILGTLDRFMAFLIEETKGAFPTWLAPVQVKVLPISDKHLEYANKVKEALQDKEVRVEVDDRAEKIGYKIREAQLQKVPYMLVVGDKEQEAGEVGVRNRKDGDVGAMKLEDFVEKIETFAK